jgi:hypothetical protein
MRDRSRMSLDDLSPAQLWRLLEEHQQSRLYRDFFRAEWGEFAACLADQLESPGGGGDEAGLLTLAKSVIATWLRWRDRAVLRMLQAGEIRNPR